MAKRQPKGAMELAFMQSQKIEEALFGVKEEKEMVKEVKVINGEDVAVVKLGDNGEVEIVRDGAIVKQNDSFETVINKFKTYGWSIEQPQTDKTTEAATMNGIPVQTQKEVDEYLALHAQKSELEAKMNKLKDNVRTYMENNNLTAIQGTTGKQVYLQDAAASNSTAVFSNYDLGSVMAALNNNEVLRQVTEIRVNSEKLEALLKLDKLPKEKVEEVKALKIVKPGTPRFSVKK